jgi:hypothetical protein
MLRIGESTNIQSLGELGKRVTLAVIGAGKTLVQLSECTLRAATSVDKCRDGGQTQATEFSGAEVGRPGR